MSNVIINTLKTANCGVVSVELLAHSTNQTHYRNEVYSIIGENVRSLITADSDGWKYASGATQAFVDLAYVGQEIDNFYMKKAR